MYQLEKNAFHLVFAQYLETEFSDLQLVFEQMGNICIPVSTYM